MVLFACDGAAAVTDLAEGVIEVTTIETDPISTSINFGAMLTVDLHGER